MNNNYSHKIHQEPQVPAGKLERESVLKVLFNWQGIVHYEFIYEVLWSTKRGTRRHSYLQKAVNLKSP
jgi:hypothetical protein